MEVSTRTSASVDAEGDREIIRAGIDRALGPSLSPDRARVAFIEDGVLSVVNVDGQEERSLGVKGAAPEWLSVDRIAIVDEEGTAIVAVDVNEAGDVEVLARLGDVPSELTGR